MAYLICCEYPAHRSQPLLLWVGHSRWRSADTVWVLLTLRFARCSSSLGPGLALDAQAYCFIPGLLQPLTWSLHQFVHSFISLFSIYPYTGKTKDVEMVVIDVKVPVRMTCQMAVYNYSTIIAPMRDTCSHHSIHHLINPHQRKLTITRGGSLKHCSHTY